MREIEIQIKFSIVCKFVFFFFILFKFYFILFRFSILSYFSALVILLLSVISFFFARFHIFVCRSSGALTFVIMMMM